MTMNPIIREPDAHLIERALAGFWSTKNERGWKRPPAMPPPESFDPESRRLLREVAKLVGRRGEHRQRLDDLRRERPEVERRALQLRAEAARAEQPLSDADDPLVQHDRLMASVASDLTATEDATGMVLAELRDAVHAKRGQNLARAEKVQREAEAELGELLTRASELVQRVEEARATSHWWETVIERPRGYVVAESPLGSAIARALTTLAER